MILMKYFDCGYLKCVIFYFIGVLFFFLLGYYVVCGVIVYIGYRGSREDRSGLRGTDVYFGRRRGFFR